MTIAGQAKHAFPAFRVFIFGVEVTEDVFGVEVRYNLLSRAPSTCTLSIANPLEKYTFTTDDLILIYNDPKILEAGREIKAVWDAMSEAQGPIQTQVPDYTNYIDAIIKENIQKISDKTKRSVLEKKADVRIDGVQQPDIANITGGPNAAQLTGSAFRYPLQAEDPIFHANDPIRIFFRDPYNPQVWYYGFTGYVSSIDENVDENNQRTLTINGEGPLKLLRYARITTNPGIIDINAIKVAEQDAATRSFYEAGFTGLTLPEVLFSVVFGNDPDKIYNGKYAIGRDSINKSSVRPISMRGVGNFNFSSSSVVEYGPESPSGGSDSLSYSGTPTATVKTLAEYQSLIDHQVTRADVLDMLLSGEDQTEPRQIFNNTPQFSNKVDDVTNIITYIGTRPQAYPVDGGKLIVFVPKSLHQSINREILMRDIIDSPAMNTQFRSRLGMIFDVVDRIEFFGYESPKGDIICEFPLYDFDPDDFGGNEPISDLALYSNGGETQIINRPDIKRGPFGPRWVFDKNNTYNFRKGITDEKVRTQISSPWYFIKNYEQIGTTQQVQPPEVVTLRHLVPLYWLRLETVNPKGFISSPEAARLYAHITLNKLNSDARSLGINAAPNLGVWLNRPIFFKQKNCIGTITSFTHSITWGQQGNMDTRINVNYIRGWDGLLSRDGKKRIYTPIGGTPSQPLDYKLLFGLKNNEPSGNKLPPAKKKANKIVKNKSDTPWEGPPYR